MESNLIKDLKEVLEKYEEKSEVIRWIPICSEYDTASSAQVHKERGGKKLSYGKYSDVDVLKWVKVCISPDGEISIICQENP